MSQPREAPTCSGVILAGGRSSRLGRAKALVELGGQPLIAHVCAALAGVVDETVVVLGAKSDTTGGHEPGAGELPTGDDILAALGPAGAGITITHDAEPGLGPLSGIVAGLRATRREIALVVACDMPFLDAKLLRGLVARVAGPPPCDAVIPRPIDRLVPVCAAYRVGPALAVFAEQLAARELKPTARLDRLRAAILECDDPLLRDATPQIWQGVNHDADLAAARAIWAGRRAINASDRAR